MRLNATMMAALASRHPLVPWQRSPGADRLGIGSLWAAQQTIWVTVLPAVAIVALVGFAYWLTYTTGGTSFVYVHVGYLPILVGALFFGVPGGVVAAVMTGLSLGPVMPFDTELGLAQAPQNWLIRTGFFIAVGGTAGAITSRLLAHFRRLQMATCFDPVTNLPNSAVFYEALSQEFQATRRDRSLSCLYADHPTHEEVLLTLGSREADELTAKLARVLSDTLPPGTPLFSLPGGRFATFLACADVLEAIAVARRMMAATTAPIEVAGIPIAVASHYGIAREGLDTPDSWSLARQAAAALEHAQHRGVTIATYEQVKTHRQPDALGILGELRRALAEDQGLYLAYQPKIETASGRCVSVEALIRWNHPVLGLIPPSRFIPVVEATAMTKELTQWVVRTAVRQCAAWQADGLDLAVAVNISARDLAIARFPAFVRDTLAEHGVPPDRLELELTESAVMTDPVDSMTMLRELTEIGLTIAIDDFGTGYSSLERLRDLPAKTLKIDQSFVRHLGEAGNDTLIVRGSIALAHGIGMKVVAEGVETEAAFKVLKRLGADVVQGYLFAPPLSESDLRTWLAENAERETRIAMPARRAAKA